MHAKVPTDLDIATGADLGTPFLDFRNNGAEAPIWLNRGFRHQAAHVGICGVAWPAGFFLGRPSGLSLQRTYMGERSLIVPGMRTYAAVGLEGGGPGYKAGLSGATRRVVRGPGAGRRKSGAGENVGAENRCS